MSNKGQVEGDLKNDILAVVASAILALVAFIASVKFNLLGEFEAFTVSILLLIGGERISYTLLRKKFETRLNQANATLEGVLRSQIDSEVFPSAASAHQYFTEKMKGCTRVYNTKIRFGEDEQSDADYYTDETVLTFSNSRKSFLANGGQWHDILSENISHSSLHLAAEEVESIQPHGYRAWVLERGVIPFTNFIILHSPNGVEVLYGWAFSKRDIAPCVFMSRNKNLIQYFERQFQILEQCGEEANLLAVLGSDTAKAPE